MGKQQSQFWRYLRLGFVALAFVLYPYFVNQMTPLATLLKNVPNWVVILVAIAFAAIAIIGPELLHESKTDSEELLQKLAKKNREIIKGRLKSSLDQYAYIPVSSIDSPQHLGRPPAVDPSAKTAQAKKWRWSLKNFKPTTILPKLPTALTLNGLLAPRRQLQNLQTEAVTEVETSKPILEIFEEANRRLLILGEPGSGKTTELLQLAAALAEAAKKDPEQPVPIIFELSAWRGEPMLDWMADQMAWQYGVNLQLCRDWLKKDRIVPLLDGLDELGDYRDGIKQAIQQIDILQEHYHEQQSALVICCRIKDYEAVTDDQQNRILIKKIDRAVRLCPLSDQQIQDYLRQRKKTHLWQELSNYPGWMKLARNPMLLNLMPIAYPDRFPKNTPQDPQTCQNRLFEDFLQKKLQSQPLEAYRPKQSQHYLAWLAASMQREGINQREFLIEGLQPTWLETAPQWRQYRLIFGLIFGLIGGLIFGLIGGPIGGLIGGPIGGLIVGLIWGNSDDIELTEALDLSWNGIKRGLIGGLIGGLIVGLIGGLIVGLIVGPIVGLIVGPIVGPIGGLIVGLIGGLIGGLKAELKVRTYPNQGIWETGMKTLITIGLALPLCPLIIIVPNWATGQEVNLVEALIGGGGMGILIGFYAGGGMAMVQHFALRWVLSRGGRMPWNYAKFLTAASDAGILKQSGGRYRFYHDKLREYLARGIELKIEPKPISKIGNLAKSPVGIIFLFFLGLLLSRIVSSTFAFNQDSVMAMNPVIQVNDRVWYDRITYLRWRSPQRDDAITFSTKDLAAEFEYTFAFRRIIALPGETIEIHSGKIILNGKPFTHPDIKLPPEFAQPAITLGADEYYVIGHNPDYPNLSTFGAVVPRQNIHSELVLRIYPFNRFGWIR